MARDTDERRDSPRRASSRLDVPRATRRAVPRPTYDPEALGRFSERVARFLGTAAFLAWMTVVIVAWVVWNFWGPGDLRWDDYPFIFLTLVLSLQASYSAPLILLAQNRQEGRDRVNLEQDRDQTARAHADMEILAREVATRDYVRSELRSLLAELDERAGSDSGDQQPVDRTAPRSLDA
jgi:uncharacterized membrane protein